MDVFDELEQLEGHRLRHRLGRPSTRQSLAEQGTDRALACLEAHIESSIGPEWGATLHRLDPDWNQLNRWIRLSKIHGLAAVDALRNFSDEKRFPLGADAHSIHEALDWLLSKFGNPRLKRAAKSIRHAWPLGPRPRHAVSVPDGLVQAADLLLETHGGWVEERHEALALGLDAPESDFEYWNSLVEFCEQKQIVSIVDWRECSEEIIASLRKVRDAPDLDRVAPVILQLEKDTHEVLEELGAALQAQGAFLVNLDRGADDYPLAFLPPDTVGELQRLIALFNDDAMSIKPFTKQPSLKAIKFSFWDWCFGKE